MQRYVPGRTDLQASTVHPAPAVAVAAAMVAVAGLLALLPSLLPGGTARADDAATAAQASNLRVLPAGLRPGDVDVLMKRYSRELGVQCSYCHVEDAATGRLDYAADDAPAKQSARLMIAMVEDINTRYIAQLGDLRYIDPVTCGTCHRGSGTPAPVAAR